jgi:hypothetical protein
VVYQVNGYLFTLLSRNTLDGKADTLFVCTNNRNVQCTRRNYQIGKMGFCAPNSQTLHIKSRPFEIENLHG